MKYLLYLILLSLTVLSVSPLFAQNAKISGSVISYSFSPEDNDYIYKEEIIDAHIILKKEDTQVQEAHTPNEEDESWFSFEGLEAGAYSIEVEAEGYFPKNIRDIELSEGHVLQIDIALIPRSNEAEVIDYEFPEYHNASSWMVISSVDYHIFNTMLGESGDVDFKYPLGFSVYSLGFQYLLGNRLATGLEFKPFNLMWYPVESDANDKERLYVHAMGLEWCNRIAFSKWHSTSDMSGIPVFEFGGGINFPVRSRYTIINKDSNVRTRHSTIIKDDRQLYWNAFAGIGFSIFTLRANYNLTDMFDVEESTITNVITPPNFTLSLHMLIGNFEKNYVYF